MSLARDVREAEEYLARTKNEVIALEKSIFASGIFNGGSLDNAPMQPAGGGHFKGEDRVVELLRSKLANVQGAGIVTDNKSDGSSDNDEGL